ncbi:hypothetical protein PsYK624_156320 [Phanerochaete sordida]|uniref:MULE transposase domain-containing protein n=1 Tax=Phanerochaete sordida TaxID=48140 RepID=A0A9P3GP86_9APHY|nr:hypothetical protein PsYK624_156320 [Phanerochaete sordida]
MDLPPRIPLHPKLRDFALDLDAVGNANHRYILTSQDSTLLYQSYRRENGMIQRTRPEDNLDKWFHAENPMPPIHALTEALIHYQPHVPGENDCFMLLLSTPQQREMAWKFEHKRQLIMDGTFGVCSARLLLFILLVINDCNHGIPVAWYFFSAKEDHTRVHASYDGAVLTAGVQHFKEALGRNATGEEFEIVVANTDNDSREQTAISAAFPRVTLLLCSFHTWQSWRAALNKHLCTVPKGDPRQDICSELSQLLYDLINKVTDY